MTSRTAGNKEMTTDQIRTAVRKAKENNPPGVLLLPDQHINGWNPKLAGYLGLKNTMELHLLAYKEHSLAAPIMKNWVDKVRVDEQHWKQSFSLHECFKLINTPSMLGTDDLPIILGQKDFPEHIRRTTSVDDIQYIRHRTHIYTLRTIALLFKMLPESFCEERADLLLNHSAEDWHRGYMLLIAFNKRGHETYARDPRAKGSKKQNHAAIRPLYLNDFPTDAGDAVTDEQASAEKETDTLESIEEIMRKFDTWDAEISNRRVNKLEDNLASISTNPSADIDKDNCRRPLTDAQRSRLCKQLYKKAIIYYPYDLRLDLGQWESFLDKMKLPDDEEAVVDRIHQEAYAEESRMAMHSEATDKRLRDMEDMPPIARDFHAMRRETNAVSASTPSYSVACEAIFGATWIRSTKDGQQKLPSSESRVMFYPWQITGAAWLRMMSESDMGFAILADDMGLGKTLTTILYLYRNWCLTRDAFLDRTGGTPQPKAKGLENLKKGPFKPILIIMPPSAIASWVEDLKKFKTFAKRTHFYMMTDHTIPEVKDILGELAKFDANDPVTGTHIFVTTYQTLYKRTFFTGQKPRANKSDDEPQGEAEEVGFDDEDAQASDVDNAEQYAFSKRRADEEDLRDIPSTISGYFDIVVCDEAHIIRNPNTRTTRAVLAIDPERYLSQEQRTKKPPFYVLITATSMPNKAADLGRLLTLFFRTEWGPAELTAAKYALCDYEDCDRLICRLNDQIAASTSWPTLNTVVQADDGDPVDLRGILWPSSFLKHSLPSGGVQMSAAAGRVIIPPVLRLIQLRRITSHFVQTDSDPVFIGRNIPPYIAINVELMNNVAQTKTYLSRYQTIIASGLGLGEDKKTGEALVDSGVLRRMRHSTLTPYLEDAYHRIPLEATEVTKAHSLFGDGGATLFFMATSPARMAPAYSDRKDMAIYMANPSQKLCWLAGFLNYVCGTLKEKVLLFCSQPTTVLFLTAFIQCLSFKCCTMRSGHNSVARRTIGAAFNDPDNPIQIMIASLAIGGTSWNLQDACRFLVYVDVPPSQNSANQGIGRLFRIRQKHKVIVFTLVLNHSADQRFEAKMALKALAPIAGQLKELGKASSTKPPSDNPEVDEWLAAGGSSNPPRPTHDINQHDTAYRRAAELFRISMGQRSNKARQEYVQYNPYQKDELDDEAAYRDKFMDYHGISEQDWKFEDGHLDLFEPRYDSALDMRLGDAFQLAYRLGMPKNLEELPSAIGADVDPQPTPTTPQSLLRRKRKAMRFQGGTSKDKRTKLAASGEGRVLALSQEFVASSESEETRSPTPVSPLQGRLSARPRAPRRPLQDALVNVAAAATPVGSIHSSPDKNKESEKSDEIETAPPPANDPEHVPEDIHEDSPLTEVSSDLFADEPPIDIVKPASNKTGRRKQPRRTAKKSTG